MCEALGSIPVPKKKRQKTKQKKKNYETLSSTKSISLQKQLVLRTSDTSLLLFP
jgi:hypothetical protein